MIEIGELVRDIEGKIYKVETKTTDDFLCLEIHSEATDVKLLSDLEIVKHSKNIIELIEVGDYVNGYLVTEVYDEMIQCLDGEIEYWTDEIEDIVTKEKFNSSKYVIPKEK